MQARALTPDDAALWRHLRLEALRLYPQAFLTSYAEAEAKPLSEIAAALAPGNTFGVFDQDVCCGIASLIPFQRKQMAHRAEIGAFFVDPSAQGHGAADTLMRGILERAKLLGRWQTELFVAKTNARAIAFYTRHGFRKMGTLPNATIIDGKVMDDLFCTRIDEAAR